MRCSFMLTANVMKLKALSGVKAEGCAAWEWFRLTTGGHFKLYIGLPRITWSAKCLASCSFVRRCMYCDLTYDWYFQNLFKIWIYRNSVGFQFTDYLILLEFHGWLKGKVYIGLHATIPHELISLPSNETLKMWRWKFCSSTGTLLCTKLLGKDFRSHSLFSARWNTNL